MQRILCLIALFGPLACGSDPAPPEPVEANASGGEVPPHAAGDAAFPVGPARPPLAPGVIARLEALDTDVEVRVVFSPEIPPPWSTLAEELRAIIAQYARHANGHLRHGDVVIDPSRTEIDGVPRVQQPVMEGTVYRTVELFRGAVIRSAHGEHVLPYIDDAAEFERTLLRYIQLLSHPPHAIGVVASLYREGDDPTLGLGEVLGHYRVHPATLAEPVSTELRALLLVEPQGLDEVALRHLARYLKQGGCVAVLGGGLAVTVGSGTPYASPGTPGLLPLLEPWGVTLGDRLVLDPRSVRVPMRSAVGFVPVPYPPGPSVPLAEDHPLRPVGESVNLLFTGALTLSGPLANGEVWLRSSEESTSLALDPDQPFLLAPREPSAWPTGGEPGAQPLLVALEGTLPLPFGMGDTPAGTRVLVAGTGSFLRPDFRAPAALGDAQTDYTIAHLLIDWLVGDGPSIDDGA